MMIFFWVLGISTFLHTESPDACRVYIIDSAKRPHRRFSLDEFYQCRIGGIGVTAAGDAFVSIMVKSIAGQAELSIIQRQFAVLRSIFMIRVGCWRMISSSLPGGARPLYFTLSIFNITITPP